MKHYLHLGLGRMFNLDSFKKEERSYQLERMSPFINDPNSKIWANDNCYYSEKELEQIKNSDFIDEFIHESVCTDWPNAPLFDNWECCSVMEHVKADEAQLFIEKLHSKVAKGSEGWVHIDLSDHYGGTEKLSDNEFAAVYCEKNDNKSPMYLNRIGADQWLAYFSHFFTFRLTSIDELSMKLHEVRPR